MNTTTITIAEVERRLVEARLEFERTGDAKDRDVVLTLAAAREKLRQADALAWARAANEAGDAQLRQCRALVEQAAPAAKLMTKGRR